MKSKQLIFILAIFALAIPLAAQMGFGSRTQGLNGIWHPVVGSGGDYETTDRNGNKSHLEIAIVGKEDVDGKTNYWMELKMANPRSSRDMYVKTLMSVGDAAITTTRTIIQMPGSDPMEMNMNMNPAGGRGQTTPIDIRDKAEHVGSETITVPAGTFSCEHYRMKDGTGDAWVSDKVTPWGLVKSQSKDSSLTLTKVITDATDHIIGTPKPFDPMQMMRDRQGQ